MRNFQLKKICSQGLGLALLLGLMMFLGGCGREQAASVAKTPTATPGAGAAPQVSSVNPANLFDCEPINRKITAAFSKAMDPLTITTATFLVTGISPVTGTVVWDATNNIALFKPSSNLAPDAIYTATITTSAKDTTGNPLASNFSWSFESCLTADATAPTVSSTVPANTARWAEMNSFQVVFWHRFGAGAMPYPLSTFATVWSDTRWRRLAKAPTIR